MTSRLTEVIVDCHDLDRMTDFWCAVLGYEKAASGEGWIAIRWPADELTEEALVAAPQPPAVAFVLVPEAKTTKNRVHIDVTPVGATKEEEVERLTALGALPADVGQRDTPWTVMADPEGNEFCVMPGADENSD